VVVASGQLGISPPAVGSIAAVPGVQHAASALLVPLTTSDGGQVVAAIVVDPASYAAPLQQGTFLLFTLAIACAAALALAVLLLELALGAADRELTTARLAAMGLTEGQRVRLVAVEVIPSIAAAAAAAAACAIALPRLVAPALDLSVFTHSSAPVPLRPDLASFILPLAVLLAITIIALAYEIRSGRGRGVAVTMRT